MKRHDTIFQFQHLVVIPMGQTVCSLSPTGRTPILPALQSTMELHHGVQLSQIILQIHSGATVQVRY